MSRCQISALLTYQVHPLDTKIIQIRTTFKFIGVFNKLTLIVVLRHVCLVRHNNSSTFCLKRHREITKYLYVKMYRRKKSAIFIENALPSSSPSTVFPFFLFHFFSFRWNLTRIFDYNSSIKKILLSYLIYVTYRLYGWKQVRNPSIYVRKTTDYPGLTYISAHLFILRLLTFCLHSMWCDFFELYDLCGPVCVC